MRIGVLGTGVVGNTIGSALLAAGNDVCDLANPLDVSKGVPPTRVPGDHAIGSADFNWNLVRAEPRARRRHDTSNTVH